MNDNYIIYPTHGSNVFGTTTGASYSIGFSTEAGTQAEVKLSSRTKKEISATLYLKFVKSKLGKIQIERAKKRLSKLQKLVAYSKEMGQRALYEELCGEIAILIRESEMVSFGIDRWIDLKHIDKYREIVKDKVIKWTKLENFPRVVPKKVQSQVKKLEAAKIFDGLWILYIDYTKQDLKTTKEKIRNKDPILFGVLSHQPHRLYFIADWVDEYCDLTLENFIERFKDEDPEFGVNEVKDIDEGRWSEIVQEVKDRQKRLEDTKRENWRELEKQEADSGTKLKKKRKWSSFWRGVDNSGS